MGSTGNTMHFRLLVIQYYNISSPSSSSPGTSIRRRTSKTSRVLANIVARTSQEQKMRKLEQENPISEIAEYLLCPHLDETPFEKPSYIISLRYCGHVSSMTNAKGTPLPFQGPLLFRFRSSFVYYPYTELNQTNGDINQGGYCTPVSTHA